MISIRQILLWMLCCLIIPVISLAGNDTSAASFLKSGVGSRMAGMAGVGCALGDDVSSLYQNPAGLVGVERQSVLFGGDSLPGEIRQQYLSYACPWKGKTLGLGLWSRRLDGGEKRSGRNALSDGDVNAGDILASFGLAGYVSATSSVGIAVNLLEETLDSHQADTLSLDLGWQYHSRPLFFGLSLRNSGEGLRFINQTSKLPLSFCAGLGYTPSDRLRVGLEADVIIPEDRGKLKLGIEKWLSESVAIRSGYESDLNNSPKGRYSLGIGFKQNDWQLDYAFRPLSQELGQAHCLSLVYTKEAVHQPDLIIEVENIFPSKYKRYALMGAGRVSITNNTNQPISRVRIKIFVPEYMDKQTECELSEIQPDTTKDVTLKPVFNSNVFTIDEDTPVQIEVDLEYIWKGKPQHTSSVVTGDIRSKNAIDWQEEKSIATFITPRDSTVNAFSRGIIQLLGTPDAPAEKMLFAMAIFSALSNIPIVYVPDPNTPFSCMDTVPHPAETAGAGLPRRPYDTVQYPAETKSSGGDAASTRSYDTVQYPAETLQLKCGDCDDLTVLYAACLENIGIQTAAALCPGHIFLLLNTGVPEKNADLISLDENRYVIRNGYAWIPVEITEMGKTFLEAWDKGSKEYRDWMGMKDLRVINLEDAWSEYHPATLPAKPPVIRLPDMKGLKETIAAIGREQEAIKDRIVQGYQACLEEHPDDIMTANKLGVIYARHNEAEKAEAVFGRMPDNASTHNNLGNVYCLEGRYEEAAREYHQAAQGCPDDGGIYFNLGLVHMLMARDDQAIEYFHKSWGLCQDANTAIKIFGVENIEPGLKGVSTQISMESMKMMLTRLYKLLGVNDDRKEAGQKKELLKTLFAGTRGDAPFKGQAISWVLYWR